MITTSGRRRLGERDRGRAVGRLADHANARRAREGKAKALANDFVVVRDEAGDLVGHGAILRRGSAPSCRRLLRQSEEVRVDLLARDDL